jgi:hypothetical protein
VENEKHRYLIDTDVLAHIQQRGDSRRLYTGVIGLAKRDRVKTVRQVMDELKSRFMATTALSRHTGETF